MVMMGTKPSQNGKEGVRKEVQTVRNESTKTMESRHLLMVLLHVLLPNVMQ
jgi:hypothetical protein